MRFRTGALGLALAASLGGCAWLRGPETPRNLPGVDAAGVEMPLTIGPYRIAHVEYGGDPAQGAFVRYAPADSSSGLPRIDVVVYPANGVHLPSEIARAHARLLDADRASPRVDDTTLLGEALFPIRAADDTAYRATYYAFNDDVPERSLVYLHEAGGRFVKARSAFTFHPGYDPARRVDDVVSALFAVAVPRD